jgi:hypothetical protein
VTTKLNGVLRVAMFVALVPLSISLGICLIVPAAWIAAAIGLGILAYPIELVGLLVALGMGVVLPIFIDPRLWGQKGASQL